MKTIILTFLSIIIPYMVIAFVTDSDHPDLTEDDLLLAHYLTSDGYHVVPAVWDDTTIIWTTFDGIIVRSAWDYFHKIDAFNNWLNDLELQKVKIYNTLSVLRWNQDKRYLIRFKNAGVKVPPMHYIHQNDKPELYEILKHSGWSKAVIKPVLSAGAYNTWIVEMDEIEKHQAGFENLISQQDVIVQKFSTEIIDHGEISLIYFNKKFSHAVCKKAKPGDFRVQSEHGGYHTQYAPDAELIGHGDTILAQISEPLLYARIDGFIDFAGQFYLMEIELLEPTLFFDSDPMACRKFAAALNQFLPVVISP